MPKFIINTNVSKDNVPDCLIEELTQQLPKALGKPAQLSEQEKQHLMFLRTCKHPFNIFGRGYLALQISTDQLLSFHGSKDPCAMCFLYSIGKIGEQENKDYSKLLCDLLNKHLKIPADRIYISYFDMSAANVGWNRTTFA